MHAPELADFHYEVALALSVTVIIVALYALIGCSQPFLAFFLLK